MMIGKIVEHIFEAGFNVFLLQRKHLITLRITQFVGDQMCAVDWALSREMLRSAIAEETFMEKCDERLHWLRKAIEEKGTQG